ncbi:Elongator subunit elp4 [Microbotryomycetes sp. JL201]|nr:Elongator subunit elp4 [Microbotryomycetes sp. JL201]
MSSFKRRVTTVPIAGTRPSPYNSLTLLSTGLSALDDILGGGLPLSTAMILQADDVTTYGDMLLKFWVAQGLESNHECVVVGSSLDILGPHELINTLMDVDGGSSTNDSDVAAAHEDDDSSEKSAQQDKLKIAFRYEGMKQHATTVSSPTPIKDTDTYCSLFDLTSTRHLTAQDKARLSVIDVAQLGSNAAHSLMPADLYELVYQRIEDILTEKDCFISSDSSKSRKAVRIAISSFAAPSWGIQAPPEVLYRFMHRLRSLLRRTTATAYITLPHHLHTTENSLAKRLGHVTDAVVTLTSFASSPVLLAQFPRHQGLVSVPKLPSLNSLVPPSAKLSVLRGLGGGGEGRENNLGFRVKRRRFVIETVNADDPIGPEQRKPVSKKDATAVDSPVKVVKASSEDGGKPSVVVARETKVRFGGEQVLKDTTRGSSSAQKPPSVSSMLHKQPELFEF